MLGSKYVKSLWVKEERSRVNEGGFLVVGAPISAKSEMSSSEGEGGTVYEHRCNRNKHAVRPLTSS